jgi:two-component system, OmpR family, response regulator
MNAFDGCKRPRVPCSKLACGKPAGRPDPRRGCMKIFYIDADHSFRDHLAARLRDHGCEASVIDDPASLAASGAAGPMPLLLLGAPSDLAALRDIGCPCLVLAEEGGCASALELGADDCIQRTAPVDEIAARIRAVLRRRPPSGWVFVPERRLLTRPDGAPVALTTAEFSLLRLLVQRQGTPVSRAALFAEVFGRCFNPSDRAIDSLVTKLRRKLGDTGRPPSMVRSVRPVGYVFTGFDP